MDANLVVHGDAHDGAIAESSHNVALFGARQELHSRDERSVGLLDPF